MKPSNPPKPEYAFAYQHPPKQGNEINGLGATEPSRARHVFHDASGERIEHHALDSFFSYINPWGVVRQLLANTWQLRRQDGPVNSERVAATDPQEMALEVKNEARRLGAELVGITDIVDDAVYDGHEIPHRYAICIGLSMDRNEMIHVPQTRAAVEVMNCYRRVSRIAIELGEKIRGMGWPARAYGNPNCTDILHIPLAIRAGLGQLGKHGSMISKEFGSNFRLATVVTDLPMATDGPVDIGVEDLCLTCRRCVIDCPPDAISDEKQLVRGRTKWYVDFDKCVPYFVKTFGCAICIEVCPWSDPGRGQSLSDRLLARRGAPSDAAPPNL